MPTPRLGARRIPSIVGDANLLSPQTRINSHPLTLSPSHPLPLSPSHPLTLSPSHPLTLHVDALQPVQVQRPVTHTHIILRSPHDPDLRE